MLHAVSSQADRREIELAYAEITASVTLASTTEATPTNVISAGAVTFDGSTRVCIEFYCVLLVGGTAGSSFVNLWDDTTTDLGRLGQGTVAGGGTPCLVRRFLTPSAAVHTYRVRGWTGTTGNGAVNAGAGGAATYMPAYIRITVADAV